MSSSSSSWFDTSNNNSVPVVNRRSAGTPTLTNAPVRRALKNNITENNITENNLGHGIPDGNTRAFYEKNGSLVVLHIPEDNMREEVQQQPDGSFMVVRIIGPNSSARTITPLRRVYTNRTEAGLAQKAAAASTDNNLQLGGRRRRSRSRRQRTNRRNTRRRTNRRNTRKKINS